MGVHLLLLLLLFTAEAFSFLEPSRVFSSRIEHAYFERYDRTVSLLSAASDSEESSAERFVDPPSAATGTDPNDLGGYDPYEKFGGRQIEVGNPQLKVKEKERSVTSILSELAAIQKQGPQKYCILGTRHCSYLHQQIIELL